MDASQLNTHDFTKLVLEESWTYIKTVVDIVHEPILILDKDLKIRGANEAFYKTFQVEAKDTEAKKIYSIGNGQWNIPALRKLLEEILPKNTFFKGFEVTHDFPHIGRKVMILNARQIYFQQSGATALFPSIILLAIEDITHVMVVAETLAAHASRTEAHYAERVEKFELQVKKLEKLIKVLRTTAPQSDSEKL